MDYRRPLRDQTTAARAFLFGALSGFVCGALVVGLAVWQWDSVTPFGFGEDAVTHGGPASPAADSGGDTSDDGDVALGPDVERPVPGTTGTAGRGAPVAVPHPEEPGAEALPAGELAHRGLIVPVEGITPDQLVPSFSESRGSRVHEALDILAPRGTPVLAVEDGQIARLFESRAGGITIYQFDPAGEYCYYYAHLDRYAEGLAEGQQVRKGQVIGYVGASGNAPKDTPHLHFAIFRLTPERRWWEGTPIDPFEVLGGGAS